MNKIKSLILAVGLMLVLPALALAEGQTTGDPCALDNAKQVVQASISSATTTSLIAPVTGSNIYVCGYSYYHPGGTGTLALEYGTGATCGTGTVIATPKWAGNTTAGTPFAVLPGYSNVSVFSTGSLASSRLCAVSTGTIAQEISVSFVQTPSL